MATRFKRLSSFSTAGCVCRPGAMALPVALVTLPLMEPSSTAHVRRYVSLKRCELGHAERSVHVAAPAYAHPAWCRQRLTSGAANVTPTLAAPLARSPH